MARRAGAAASLVVTAEYALGADIRWAPRGRRSWGRPAVGASPGVIWCAWPGTGPGLVAAQRRCCRSPPHRRDQPETRPPPHCTVIVNGDTGETLVVIRAPPRRQLGHLHGIDIAETANQALAAFTDAHREHRVPSSTSSQRPPHLGRRDLRVPQDRPGHQRPHRRRQQQDRRPQANRLRVANVGNLAARALLIAW